MTTTNLGKVAVVPKGEYSSAVQYERLDIVQYERSSYLVKQAVIGVAPTDGAIYALLASKGDSSYDVAVNNGFIGTEEEWTLYLKSDGSIQALQQFMTNPASTEVSVPDYGNIPSLQGYISTMFENGGLPANRFKTYAALPSELPDDSYALVSDDTDTNNGLYIKEGGSWVKSKYDFMSIIYNAITQNEWTIAASGVMPVYDADTNKLTWSSNIAMSNAIFGAKRVLVSTGSLDIDATSVDNGVLFLDLKKVPSSGNILAGDVANCFTYAAYPTFTAATHQVPIAKRDNTKNGGDALVAVNGFVDIKNNIDVQRAWNVGRNLEWFLASGGGKIQFDVPSKTLSWTTSLVATYKDQAAMRRISIDAGSIQLNTMYDMVYIDLSKLNTGTKKVTNADIGTVLKIGNYTDSFEHNLSQVPLAKFDLNRNTLYPCAGFVDIEHIGGNSTTPDVDAFEYVKTVGTLSCYLPTTSGKKIKIGMIYLNRPFDGVAVNSQSDLWRLFRATQCNPTTLEDELEFVNSGEWECAIQHDGATDYCGGYHGDELASVKRFYIDGVEYAHDFYTSKNLAKKIEYVQQSIIYFENTQTQLAEHFKHVTIDKHGVTVDQSLRFLTEVTLRNAQMAMLPMLRKNGDAQVTNASSRSIDYFTQVDDVTEPGFNTRYTVIKDGSKVKLWGTSSKISVEVEFEQTVNYNDSQSVYIFNGADSNKVYMTPLNYQNTTTEIANGTIWRSKTNYNFDIAS